MQLYFEGVDIAPRVDIASAGILDSAGGQLDSVEVTFADPQGLWSRWSPAIDDVLRLAKDGFDSGDCFVDQLGQQRGLYVLRGLSAPSAAKVPRSRSWESVAFLQLGADVAANYGFSLSVYGAPNPVYARVDQAGAGDLSFLQERCALEGCALKVSGRKIIVYSEALLEAADPARTILRGDFCGDLEYRQQKQGTYARCVVSYGGISGEFAAPGRSGDTLYRTDLCVTSIGEAQRFAKGLLRQANRLEHLLIGSVLLDMTLAGGGMVSVSGIGTADGLYMIDQAEHRLTDGITALRLRRRLEGY